MLKICIALLIGVQSAPTPDADFEKMLQKACPKAPDSPVNSFCATNDNEEDCESGSLCCWDGESCNADTVAEKDCDSFENIGKCSLKKIESDLEGSENKPLDEEEQAQLSEAIKSDDSEEPDETGARSLFLNGFAAFGGVGSFGSGGMMGPAVPMSMLSAGQQLATKYITCPLNIPYCQRQACQDGNAKVDPQYNAYECFKIPGCCFDNDLHLYKSAFGAGFIKAPTCYRAIRTPIFHILAEQITMKGEFYPNFLPHISDRVNNFIAEEKSFNLMLEYHHCVSSTRAAPSRMRFESYLAKIWPAYNYFRMMGKSDKIVTRLVSAFSRTCGWPQINKEECMQVGCCWSVDKDECSHAIDLTAVDPQKMVNTVARLTLISDSPEEEEEETDAPLPGGSSSGSNSLPSSGSDTPPFADNSGRSTSTQDLIGSMGRLPMGLVGKRRRRRQSGNMFSQLVAMAGNKDMMGALNLGNILPNMMGGTFNGGLSNAGNLMALQAAQGGSGNTLSKFMAMQAMQNSMNQGTGNTPSDNANDGNFMAMQAMRNTMNPGSSDQPSIGFGFGALFPSLNNYQQKICKAVEPSMNCMAAVGDDVKLKFSELISMRDTCEIKGCCWDSKLEQQLLLGKASSGFSSVFAHQCPWKAPTMSGDFGLPDLSDSIRGCCSQSPCIHTEQPADWSVWGEWTNCPVQCGGGETVRSRTCDGNGFCPGMKNGQREDIMKSSCNTQSCESWEQWENWSVCTASCGAGQRSRERLCVDVTLGQIVPPPGKSGGCAGTGQSFAPCTLGECPILLNWSPWSQCTSSCGLGAARRSRRCSIPGMCNPSMGEVTEMKQCGSSCWSQWSMWSDCTKNCGTGKKFRLRDCTFKAETGMECAGSDEESVPCNTAYCENWVQWAPWSACEGNFGQTCGNGRMIRSRACTGEIGQPGCRGQADESRTCSIGICQWSEWRQDSQCSRTCGNGLATYSRTCPSGTCPGSSKMTKACIDMDCPKPLGWDVWSEWTACDAECGRGTQTRSRECVGQLGINCVGSDRATKTCYTTCDNGNRFQFGQTNPSYNNQQSNSWDGLWNTNSGYNTNTNYNTGYGTNSNYGYGTNSYNRNNNYGSNTGSTGITNPFQFLFGGR